MLRSGADWGTACKLYLLYILTPVFYQGLPDGVSTQPELEFKPPAPTNPGRLEADFLEFHQKNPKVYQKFCEHCEELLAAGFKRYSADGIVHKIRFDLDVAVKSTTVDTDGHPIKINNNTVRYYAELWTREHPAHPDFFQSRKNQHG